MIKVTEKAVSPEMVIDKVKTAGSGCVVTYVGLIRNSSQNKPVVYVEYRDVKNKAVSILQDIADEAKQKWEIENIAITHRTGKLEVGDINLVVAVAADHRSEGFAACQYIINRFKEKLPTMKIETYQNGSVTVS